MVVVSAAHLAAFPAADTAMTVTLKKPPAAAVPIHATDRDGFAALKLPAATRRWLQAVGFSGAPDTHALVPGPDGALQEVWAGVRTAQHPWVLAALPRALPPGRYRLGDEGLAVEPQAAAFSWELGSYIFDLYKPARRVAAELMLAPGVPARRGLLLATAVASTRDLVNTPAEHLGPAELAAAAQAVAQTHGAKFKQVVGDALLKARFPAIHAVGRAADAKTRAPRLIELTWGNPKHKRLSIVGKGVCFDNGGLNIKGGEGMRLMKKDMGGAANALGLAQLVMALKLPVHLQVLIPAVENAISGNAYRPGDVFKTRSGLHIEIGNTDAEGRVILCDALAYAAEAQPDLIIDLATSERPAVAHAAVDRLPRPHRQRRGRHRQHRPRWPGRRHHRGPVPGRLRAGRDGLAAHRPVRLERQRPTRAACGRRSPDLAHLAGLAGASLPHVSQRCPAPALDRAGAVLLELADRTVG
jgi:leucyl aminopeptidase